jgi:hypothetical protein
MQRALLILALTTPALAHAGAWVRAPGSVYAQLGPSYFVGDPMDSGSVTQPSATFSGRALEGYAEVGLVEGLELDLSARWVDQRHAIDDAEDTRTTGLSDLECLLKWRPGDATLSLSGGLRVAPYETLSLEDEAAGEPALGPGGVDLVVGAGWGQGLSAFNGWVNVSAQHRIRLDSPSAGLRLEVELGWRPTAALALAGVAHLQPAYGRRLDGPEDAPLPIPTAGGLGAKLLAAVHGPWGVAVDVAWLPDALNDGPGRRLALGLTYAD